VPEAMKPEVERQIKELMDAGLTVYGPIALWRARWFVWPRNKAVCGSRVIIGM